MKDWHWASELHHSWLSQAELLIVPLGSLKEETRDESTVLRMLVDLSWLLWHWQKVEFKLVNWSPACFSTESLKKRSCETSWVSECSDPEVVSGSLSRPFSEEFISFNEVTIPISKWLQ